VKLTPVNIKKLPNKVIHACKNNTEKNEFVENSGAQIRLCLITFQLRQIS